MSQFITTTISAGQAVVSNQIYLRNVLITPAAAVATATIYGNGVAMVKLQASANGSSVVYAAGGQASNEFSADIIPGPVTVDLTGAGAFLKLTY
jgi:hypothetical protein